MTSQHVGLVTTDEEVLNGEDVDQPELLRALHVSGIQADYQKWHDPSVAWAEYDLLIMRSPWDYPRRTSEFLEWLAAVRKSVPVLNCPDLITWNLDKHYIAELSSAGVPCVESHFCSSPEEVQMAIGSISEPEIVVKPAVSMGSRDTGRFRVEDESAMDLAGRIFTQGKTVLVQPFIKNGDDVDERSLVFFDGTFSHALTRSPVLNPSGGYLGGEYTETVGSVPTTTDERTVASAAFTAVGRLVRGHGCTCLNTVPLYGRIDVVTDPAAGPLLLEAELFEPSFFVETSPGSADRFAAAVVRRLAEL